MTIETLIAVAAILYVISVAAERFIEFAKPWFNKITNQPRMASFDKITCSRNCRHCLCGTVQV